MTNEELLDSKLISYVEAMISEGRYPEYSRLPSLRDLGQRFGLSPTRVRRCLQCLCERNILEFRHGSGTYVKPRSGKKESCTISVILFDRKFKNSYCSYAVQGIQAKAVECGWQLHLYFYTYGSLKKNYNEEIFRNCDAIILMGCYDCYKLDWFPRKLPGVGLEMHSSLQGRFSTVTIDPFDAAIIAAEHFRSMGIRYVKVISAKTPVHQMRARIFVAEWGEQSEIIDRTDFSEPDFISGVGYLFVSGSIYEICAKKFFRQYKKNLAENKSVLSIDGKNLITTGYQPANTITIDWKKTGETVAEECLRRLKTPDSQAQRIYISPKLRLYDEA